MIKVSYKKKYNVVIIEFIAKVDVAQAELFYSDVQQVLLKCGKGLRLLTDLSLVEEMDLEVRKIIKKVMDLFNKQKVSEIIRVVSDPSQDIGFGIMSIFHYAKEIPIIVLKSREEANELLRKTDLMGYKDS